MIWDFFSKDVPVSDRQIGSRLCIQQDLFRAIEGEVHHISSTVTNLQIPEVFDDFGSTQYN